MCIGFGETKSGRRKGNNKATTLKLKFVNVSTQTDDKIHVGCHDLATEKAL